MGVNNGDESPEFEVGTLMQIVPKILLCFKISSIILLALQYSKKLATPMMLTEYSLLNKSTS